MKWLIFDLDGTLLNNENKIPQDTKLFLEESVANGYKLAIATGRPYFGVTTTLSESELSMFDKICSFNGARIDQGTKTIKQKINKAKITKMLEGPFAISTSDDQGNFYIDRPKLAGNILKRYKNTIWSFSEHKEQDVYFIRLIFENKDLTQKTFQKLKNDDRFKDYNISTSTGVFMLITKKGASKRDFILNHFSLEDTIYFFGDSGNDINPMKLKHVIGVAPKNASLEVAKVAKINLKTTNNQTLRINVKAK